MAEVGKDDLLLIHAEQLDEKLKGASAYKSLLIGWSDQEKIRQIIHEWKTFKRKEIQDDADRLSKIPEKLEDGNKAKNSKKG